MLQNKSGLIILVLLSGFAGGFVSNCLFAHAQDVQKVVMANAFQLVGNNGKVIGTWVDCGNNSPCINLYDANNNIRLQLGIYGDPSENGLPFIGLFDEKFQIKELLRLYGSLEAPVLVMKNNDQDRMIMGLDFQDANTPFLVTYNNDGSQQTQFGHYGGR